MNEIYFTSDTHFFHANIIKYCNRPFDSVEEMNESLIERWNAVVSKNSIVYHLGDFAFAAHENISKVCSRLNGNIILVKGNHDKFPQSMVGSGKAFSQAHNYLEINIEDYPPMTLNHYAQRTWNKARYGAYHLFGHSHGNMEPLNRSVDVGVDSSFITGIKEYRPFHIDEIKSFMDKVVV